ncbi:MAG: PfkB family carbohydrate kinase [Kiritimatiellia bacterium]
MSRKEIEIVEGFEKQRIFIVGDLMLDRYVRGSVGRISPEAPVPVVRVGGESAVPGGAANVALNIRSLGGEAAVGGFVGADASGDELIALMEERGIGTKAVVRTEKRCTTVKTRIVAERQQVARVDHEEAELPSGDMEKALAGSAVNELANASGVILEDYGKGAVCRNVVNGVLGSAREKGIRTALDPKDNHELEIPAIDLATPNYREACLAAGLRERGLSMEEADSDEGPASHPVLREAGERLLEKWHAEILVITLGKHGMYLVRPGGKASVVPANAREVFDVCGAGDTVVAACLLALSAGAEPDTAVGIANTAAGIVVGKLGTATCSREELVKALGEGEES